MDDLIKVGFGSSGVRGLVTDLTDDVCFAYSLSFLQHLRSQGLAAAGSRVALGHDLRPSSPRISQACIAAIRFAGLEVDFCGPVPTPTLALHGLAHHLPAIMITGSHIPFDRNGIKFYGPSGEILKPDELAIREGLAHLPAGWRQQVVLAPLPEIDGRALADYKARYVGAFPRDLLAGQRIGIYQHSSVARDLLSDLVASLGGEPVALGRSDQFVPIDTEAVQEDTQELARAWAAEYHLSAILSTDGDADRPLIGDEAGTFLRGDEVGILTSLFLKAQVVVTPVSSNSGLERTGAFAQILRTRIGSPYVIDGMLQARAEDASRRIVGFEANGGFLTESAVTVGGVDLSPLPTRDAVLPMLCLLALAKEEGKPLSSLRQRLPARFTASGRLAELSPPQVERVRTLVADPAALAVALDYGALQETNLVDGARLTFQNGAIVHFRMSGNAPEMRCYTEAESFAEASAVLARMLAKMQTLL